MHAGDDDDPFMQDATAGDGFDDPFDLVGEGEFLRRNLLPVALLPKSLQYCDGWTLLAVTQVNHAWHEAADSDEVWKVLVKAKFGDDTVKEHKSHCRHLGWKLAYFVGICKTLLVNTPEKLAVALVSYPGLTVRDMLNSIGIEKVHHYRVSSQNFTDDLNNEIEEEERDGDRPCWPSLASAAVSDVLVEPFSTIYVESMRRRDRQPARREDSDDDDGPEKDARRKVVEQNAKTLWRDRAQKRRRRVPAFVWRGKLPHLDLGGSMPLRQPA